MKHIDLIDAGMGLWTGVAIRFQDKNVSLPAVSVW
jgi:hypothetical protein